MNRLTSAEALQHLLQLASGDAPNCVNDSTIREAIRRTIPASETSMLRMHKKDKYMVTILSSSKYGRTTFKRTEPTGNSALDRVRNKKTHYFEYEFEPLKDE